ncbi:MAG: hypothetical protein ACOC5T_02650 [Elusimicrobiota bacterium]
MTPPVSPHCKKILTDFEDETKRKKICNNPRQIRATVICKAWDIFETKSISFLEAVDQAWDWAKDQCSQIGVYI